VSEALNEHELYVAELDSPKARELADLTGILLDLDFVHQAVGRLGDMEHDDAADPIVARALWMAALVTYARCFAGGRRAALSWSVFADVHPDAPAAHRFIMSMRDKHVAHAVNPFDQVHIGATLSPVDADKLEVLGTTSLSQTLIGWEHDGLQTLWNLAREARAVVSARAKAAQAELFEEAKAMPIEDLYGRARLQSVTPGPADVQKPR